MLREKPYDATLGAGGLRTPVTRWGPALLRFMGVNAKMARQGKQKYWVNMAEVLGQKVHLLYLTDQAR